MYTVTIIYKERCHRRTKEKTTRKLDKYLNLILKVKLTNGSEARNPSKRCQMQNLN